MKKIISWFSAVGGAVLSALGITASACIVCAPVCAPLCGGGAALAISGPLVAILGPNLSGVLYNFRTPIIIFGVLLFAIGVFLIRRQRKAKIQSACCPSTENLQNIVKDAYGKIAREGCGCGCGTDTKKFAESVGYSQEEFQNIPDSANLGLGCGNPTASANLKEGETVLDLGSGAGIDCFLAAAKVGSKGKVIGVDITSEMIEKARDNAKKGDFKNVEFRLGKIEGLPAEDNSVDVVISNCVINLSGDKSKVFREIYRVLKPGGRIAISDIALLKELPKKIRENIEAHIGCVGGALLINEYKKTVEASGLKGVEISPKGPSACVNSDTNDPLGGIIFDGLEQGENIGDFAVSVDIKGFKT